MEIIPTKLRKLWSDEQIRILVLLSLFLQIILISFSLFRKRSSKNALSLLLWLSYLGADYIATLALGNLLNKQNDAVEANTSGDIMAFWAPFLLLHLGGPDTITSYSLEDNELWARHFLNLVAEVVVAVVVFVESLPSPHVWKSAILVFAAGIIKYFERTASLYSASMENLRESMLNEADPGPNYAKFMQEYHSLKKAGLKVDIQMEKVPPPVLTQKKGSELSEAELIFIGYDFFQIFKRHTVDLMLSFQYRIESQNFFLQLKAKQAFQVVEVELSFLHDILHTKAVHVHNTRGRITRVASLAIAILALLLFHHRSGKDSHVFKSVDVLITYLLLLIAIGLEIVAILLLIFSDWTIVTLQMSSSDRLEQPYIAYVKKKLLRPKWSETIINLRQLFLSVFPEWLLGDIERWWSNKIRQYDLFGVCLRNYKRTNLDQARELAKLKGVWNHLWYVRSNQVDDVMKKHIFNELKAKAKSTEGIAAKCKCLRSCRGEWVLREKGYGQLSWICEKKFDESILIWHIATYLCRMKSEKQKSVSAEDDNSEKKFSLSGRIGKFWVLTKIGRKKRCSMKNTGRMKQKEKTILRRSHSEQDYESGDVKNVENEAGSSAKISKGEHIKICMQISEYLMYLVVYQPNLLPADIRTIIFLEATCLEVKKFLSNKMTDIMVELQNKRPKDDEKKSSTSKATGKDMKNSIFRILGLLFFRPIGSLFHQCFTESIKRVPISKKLAQDIWNWWTAITKLLLPQKIRRFFCFCIEVVKEMQPTNKVVTLEMEQLGCKKLMEVWVRIDPAMVKGDRSKSVLDAVRLASDIMEIFDSEAGEEKKWEVMSCVWVEMLCYAAGNCASYRHARQLSGGGELLTHVWLLMKHMGIRERYWTEDASARAKLFVET